MELLLKDQVFVIFVHMRQKIGISQFLDLREFLKTYQKKGYQVKAVLIKDQLINLTDAKYLGLKVSKTGLKLTQKS